MALFGNDARVNATFTATDKATPVVKALRGEMTKLGSKTGGPLGGLVSGIGGLNLGMIGAVGVGVGFVGMLADATKAAIDEDKGIAQLTASLKANVPNWQDQTDAINKAVDAAERLAFTDDSARQSLALLLPVTHDVAKATELMNLAMNLSRLRGTDLAETTTLIGKVYQGNLTSLKRFGISLKGIKTGTEALTKIQEISAGQAQAYADTTAGNYEQIDIKINDLKEDIGHGLQPVIDEALKGITNLFEGKHAEAGPLTGLIDQNNKASASMQNFNAAASALGINLTEIPKDASGFLDWMLQADQALLQGNADAEFGAWQLSKYATSLGVTTEQLKDYVVSAMASGLTEKEMIGQLKALAQAHDREAYGLLVQKNAQDKAAESADNLTAAQRRYQARLEAFARRPGANVDMLGMPRKRSVERDAISIGKAYGEGLKKGLQSQKGRVADAAADLDFAMKHPFAVKKEFMFIIGQLQGDKLRKGLNSKKPEVRAAAEGYRSVLVAELKNAPAYFWGSAIAKAYIQGLYDNGLMKLPSGWGIHFSGDSPFSQYPTGGNGGGNKGGHTRDRNRHGTGNVPFAPQGGGNHITVDARISERDVGRAVDKWMGRQRGIVGRSHSRS